MSTTALAHNIERFAQLCALLDDGSVQRAAVLDAAGLDEATWCQLRMAWLPRLAAGDALALALRFGRAYAHARRQVGKPALPESWPADLAAEDTDVDAAPPVPKPDDPAKMTVAGGFPLAGPAVPFRSPPMGTTAGLERLHSPPSRPQPAATVESAERTVEVAVLATAERAAVLPFRPTPGRRLHKFDSQTGLPLPVPIWVDEPPAPSRRS
jgi:hypothetical protein